MTLRVPIAIACSEVILRAALHDARIQVEMDSVNRDAGDGPSPACVDQCGANSSGNPMGELAYVIDNFEETKCLFGHAIIRLVRLQFMKEIEIKKDMIFKLGEFFHSVDRSCHFQSI